MLAALLPAELFAALLIFVRIGASIMLLPGFGESYVPVRVRLLLALLITLALTPVLSPQLPPMPAESISLGLLILGESFIGLFLGAIARVLLAILSVAGMVISMMSALSSALTNDPVAVQQGSIVSALLTTAAVLLIFLLDLHHLMLGAVIDSYALFPAGSVPPIADMADLFTLFTARVFLVGFQIAMPFVGVGIIFYLGLGLLARLIPRMQIFFIALPLQISIGLVMLSITLPIALAWFLGVFQESLIPFLAS